MKVAHATVINEYGIHCRPSAIIAKAAQAYEGTITVATKTSEDTDISSILNLVALGIRCNDTVLIKVEGSDEEEMTRKMVELFETNFDFPRP